MRSFVITSKRVTLLHNQTSSHNLQRLRDFENVHALAYPSDTMRALDEQRMNRQFVDVELELPEIPDRDVDESGDAQSANQKIDTDNSSDDDDEVESNQENTDDEVNTNDPNAATDMSTTTTTPTKTNATPVVPTRVFHAHRSVLCTQSTFFQQMFCGSFREQHSHRIPLPDIRASIFNHVLEFIYGREIVVSQNNISELLQVAHRLDVPALVRSCCEATKLILAPDNCCQLLGFAELLQLEALTAHLVSYMLSNFEAVSKSEDFVQIDCALLQKLLASDRLWLVPETVVFRAAAKWLLHEYPSREEHVSAVLAHIDFIGFGFGRTQQLLDHPLCAASPSAHQILHHVVCDLNGGNTERLLQRRQRRLCRNVTLVGMRDAGAKVLKSLAFCEKYVISGDNCNVGVWNTTTRQLKASLLGHTKPVTCVCVDDTNTWIVSGSQDHTVKVWCHATFACHRTLLDQKSPINAVRFLPGTNRLITAAAQVHMWDIATWSLVAVFNHSSPGGGGGASPLFVTAVDCVADVLVTGASDGCLRVWDLSTFALRRVIVAHAAPVKTLAIVSKSIVSTALTGEIRAWNLNTATEPATTPAAITTTTTTTTSSSTEAPAPARRIARKTRNASVRTNQRIHNTRSAARRLSTLPPPQPAVPVPTPTPTTKPAIVFTLPSECVREWRCQDETTQQNLLVVSLCAVDHRLVTMTTNQCIEIWDTTTWTKEQRIAPDVSPTAVAGCGQYPLSTALAVYNGNMAVVSTAGLHVLTCQ